MTWLGAEPVRYRLASEYFRFKCASFKLLLYFFASFKHAIAILCTIVFMYIYCSAVFLSRFFFVCFWSSWKKNFVCSFIRIAADPKHDSTLACTRLFKCSYYQFIYFSASLARVIFKCYPVESAMCFSSSFFSKIVVLPIWIFKTTANQKYDPQDRDKTNLCAADDNLLSMPALILSFHHCRHKFTLPLPKKKCTLRSSPLKRCDVFEEPTTSNIRLHVQRSSSHRKKEIKLEIEQAILREATVLEEISTAWENQQNKGRSPTSSN